MRTTAIALIIVSATLTEDGHTASKRDAWTPYAQPTLLWETISEWEQTPESSDPMAAIAGPREILLPPDSGIWFVLEKNSVLRLDGVDDQEAGALAIRQSDPLGLYAPVDMLASVSGHSLVATDVARENRLVWIENNGNAEADFRLLRGALASPGALPRWLLEASGNLETDWVYRYPQSEWQAFSRLNESGLTLELKGPATFEIQLRQEVTSQPFPPRDYVDVVLDGQPLQRFALHFKPDRDHRYRLAGKNTLLSRPESVYLNVSKGSHQVRLTPGFSGWLQIRKMEDRTLMDDSRPWGVNDADTAKNLLQAQALEQSRVEEKLTGNFKLEPQLNAGLPWTEPSIADSARYQFFRTLWPGQAVNTGLVHPVDTVMVSDETTLEWFFTPHNPEHSSFRNWQPGWFVTLTDAEIPYKFPIPIDGRSGALRIQLMEATPGTVLTLDGGKERRQLVYRPDLTRPEHTRLVQSDANQLIQGFFTHPELVSEVTLAAFGDADHVVITSNQPGTRLRVAVQEPNSGNLTESELLSIARNFRPREIARSWLLPARDDDMDPRLWHDSKFLREWLQSRAAQFRGRVSPTLHGRKTASELLATMDDLIAQGHHELVAGIAKGALVFPPPSEDSEKQAATRLSERAFTLLRETYLREESGFKLQTLLSHHYLSTHSDSTAVEIVEQLYIEGHLKEALRFSLGIEQQSLQARERQHLAGLSREAGVSSDWTHLAEALSEKLGSNSATEHPLPPVWRDAGHLITGERSTRWIYNPALDRVFERHQVGPDVPVRLEVTGPLELTFSLNLLHTRAQESLNDWVELTHNGQTYDVPILASRVRGNLTPVGDSEARLGSQQRLTVALSEGRHTLHLNTRQHTALLGIEYLAPNYRELPAPWAGQPEACDQFLSTLEKAVGASDSEQVMVTTDYIKAAPSVRRTLQQNCDASDNGKGDKNATNSRSASGKLLSMQPSPHRAIGDDAAATTEAKLTSILDTPDFQSSPALIARANQLASSEPGNPRVQQLLAAINQQQFWIREELVTESAGMVGFESDGWAPESDFLERRYPLLGGKRQTGESLLFGRNGRGFQLSPQTTTEYRLQLRLDKVAFQQIPPVTMELIDNNRAIRNIELSETSPEKTVTFELEPGQHKLTLRLKNPTSGHWVFARLEYRERATRGSWTPAINESQRFYHLVTRQEPLTIYVDQPSWLRIESFDGSQWFSQFVYQPEAGFRTFHRRELRGQYARVYSLRHQPDRTPLDPVVSPPELPVQTTESDTRHSNTLTADAALIHDAFKPEREDSGTHGLFADLRQRPDFDTRDSREERFLEAGYRYRRQFSEQNLHWQSDNFARLHQDSDIRVIGTRNAFIWRPERRHWRLGANANGFWQLGSEDNNRGSLLSGNVYGAGRLPVGDNVEIRHHLSVFHHWLSERNSGTNRDFDNDVFSTYKRDHRRGVDWQESLAYSPFNDTQLTTSLGLRSNDDFNLFAPDRFSLDVNWKQYWRQFRFELGAQSRWLQQDDDRSEARTQALVRGEVSRFHWQDNGQRWETGLALGYDLDSRDLRLSLSFSWDFAGQKRLTDFRPESLSFREREQAVANQHVLHNTLNYIDHED